MSGQAILLPSLAATRIWCTCSPLRSFSAIRLRRASLSIAGRGRNRHNVFAPPRFLVEPLRSSAERRSTCSRPPGQAEPLFLRESEGRQHVLHVVALRFPIGMRHVADAQQDVSLPDLLKRGAECGDQLGGKVRNEADGVGQDHFVEASKKPNVAHRRVERCEQQVFREHGLARQAVE